MNLIKRKNLHLTLVRHGESVWNKENLFTGWEDVGLTEKGEQEAALGGQLLAQKGLNYNVGYTSFLRRAQDTYRSITDELRRQSGRTGHRVALMRRPNRQERARPWTTRSCPGD